MSQSADKLIDSISLPRGLRSLDASSLKRVACELREELIDSVASSGGHFASSLGTTELTVILHALFDTPNDKIVWDVGHQAYVHKMLTGRRDRLKTIRQKGGISGFLKRNESEFDTFGAGHAGTSISAAVGMKVALDKLSEERFVVSVIGDGSLTAGMAFEALNHAGALELRKFIVVLNDNEMSISQNVGALSWLFSKAVTSKAYTTARQSFKYLHKSGYVPELIYKAIDRGEEATQSFLSQTAMLFEAFGFRYIGPVDGHNIDDLLTAFGQAKNQDVPVIVHVRTSKGKGFEPAEEDPIKWHGVTPFDRSKAEFISSGASIAPSYTQVFADTLVEIAKKDEKVIAITAAMAGGTGLDRFQKIHPQRFFDVGICEQHAVTFAAGLACEGYRPVCAIYSTFLQRAYDQVLHDVCIQNLPVVFAMDRGGVVGNDGETHQGVFDIAYLRSIPGITLMSPKDENELRHMLFTAINHSGPVAIRYPRGNGLGVDMSEPLKALPIGESEIVSSGNTVLLLCLGTMTSLGTAVAKTLKEEKGINCTVVNARFAKPFDHKLLARLYPTHSIIVTIEDHALQGGFGSVVLEAIQEQGLGFTGELLRYGIKDEFIPHASQKEQLAENGIEATRIVAEISRLLPAHQAVA